MNNNGIISTVAGNGTEGYSPWFIDTKNHKVINKSNSNNIIKNFNGDGSKATNAQLARPSKIAIDGQGNLIILDNSPSHLRVVSNVASIK